jgi:hypothetical protein
VQTSGPAIPLWVITVVNSSCLFRNWLWLLYFLDVITDANYAPAGQLDHIPILQARGEREVKKRGRRGRK